MSTTTRTPFLSPLINHQSFTFGFPHCSHLMYLAVGGKKRDIVRFQIYLNVSNKEDQQFELKVTGWTHVSARDRSSCWGSGISSSACFWRVCQRFRPSPPAPSSDTRTSSPLNPGCYRWQLAPLACKAYSIPLLCQRNVCVKHSSVIGWLSCISPLLLTIPDCRSLCWGARNNVGELYESVSVTTLYREKAKQQRVVTHAGLTYGWQIQWGNGRPPSLSSTSVSLAISSCTDKHRATGTEDCLYHFSFILEALQSTCTSIYSVHHQHTHAWWSN